MEPVCPLIFIPREGEEAPNLEDKGNKIILKTKPLSTKVYEVTSPAAKGLTEYEPILNAAVARKSEADLVLQSVDWVAKRSCMLVATGEMDKVLAGVPGGAPSLKVSEVPGQPFLLSSDFVTDRFEFEGLADLIAGCAKDDDQFYLSFDWAAKRNHMVWTTKDPADRQKCLMAQDIILQPA